MLDNIFPSLNYAHGDAAEVFSKFNLALCSYGILNYKHSNI